VERFVDRLGLKNLNIMVQDWGGPIGLGFAGRRPELVRAVILGNTFAWPAQRSKGMSAFSKVVGSGPARFLITRYNALAKWLIPAGINRKLTEQEMAAYLGPFSTPALRLPMWIFARQIVASEEYLAQVEAGLSCLRDKPVLVVWGEADGAFRAPDRVRLLEYFPRHRVCLLPDAKHFIQENAPNEICSAILAAASQG
jgi:haloalkane dehalogenase